MVIHWETLLVKGGRERRAAPENLQNVHLNAAYLNVVLIRSPKSKPKQDNNIQHSRFGLYIHAHSNA